MSERSELIPCKTIIQGHVHVVAWSLFVIHHDLYSATVVKPLILVGVAYSIS